MDMTGSPNVTVCAAGVKEGVFFRLKDEIIRRNNMKPLIIAIAGGTASGKSTVVKEIASYGGDISKFVPAELIDCMDEKYKK